MLLSGRLPRRHDCRGQGEDRRQDGRDCRSGRHLLRGAYPLALRSTHAWRVPFLRRPLALSASSWFGVCRANSRLLSGSVVGDLCAQGKPLDQNERTVADYGIAPKDGRDPVAHYVLEGEQAPAEALLEA
jgi:hypothetical protein